MRNALLIGCTLLVATTVARAQSADPIGDLLAGVTAPQPPAAVRQTVARPLSSADVQALGRALSAAKRGEVATARTAIADLSDSVARKAATWALVDTNAESLSFWEIEAARRELGGFPRPGRRQAAAERLLETSGKTPRQIVEWFTDQEPQTANGALALASAYRVLGRQAEAGDLIRRWWRDRSFEVDVQRALLSASGKRASMARWTSTSKLRSRHQRRMRSPASAWRPRTR